MNSTDDVVCKQTISGNVEIKLDNPCDGFEFISQCPPLYISVISETTVKQPSCKIGKKKAGYNTDVRIIFLEFIITNIMLLLRCMVTG
jgi:hypothetical protein